MQYKIKLPAFEGPFDLLLYLIKKHEIDIYDIPIADITRQYLEYIELMQMLDLDVAGEFIEMVATLILIKTRMLLPQHTEDGEEEPVDPRAELVAQLLEYQKFKEASLSLEEMEHRRSHYFPRKVPASVKKQADPGTDQLLDDDVSIYDLLMAFKTAMDNMPKITEHRVSVVKVTIEDQVQLIFDTIGDRKHVLFTEIIKPLETKLDLIVTFMALLDLIRLTFMVVKQSDSFGEIRLVPLKKLSFFEYRELRNAEIKKDEAKQNSEKNVESEL